MSGALTERAFVESLDRAGFGRTVVHERVPYGLDDLAREPTFTPGLVALMRRLLPPRAQDRIGVRLVISAESPAESGATSEEARVSS